MAKSIFQRSLAVVTTGVFLSLAVVDGLPAQAATLTQNQSLSSLVLPKEMIHTSPIKAQSTRFQVNNEQPNRWQESSDLPPDRGTPDGREGGASRCN